MRDETVMQRLLGQLREGAAHEREAADVIELLLEELEPLRAEERERAAERHFQARAELVASTISPKFHWGGHESERPPRHPELAYWWNGVSLESWGQYKDHMSLTLRSYVGSGGYETREVSVPLWMLEMIGTDVEVSEAIRGWCVEATAEDDRNKAQASRNADILEAQRSIRRGQEALARLGVDRGG